MRKLSGDGVCAGAFLATQEKEWRLRMMARVLVDFEGEYDRCVEPACWNLNMYSICPFPFPLRIDMKAALCNAQSDCRSCCCA